MNLEETLNSIFWTEVKREQLEYVFDKFSEQKTSSSLDYLLF